MSGLWLEIAEYNLADNAPLPFEGRGWGLGQRLKTNFDLPKIKITPINMQQSIQLSYFLILKVLRVCSNFL